MKDLINEYFRRDLTEAEKEQLTSLLSESDDAAMEFAKLAEKSYQATGLPQPVWTGKALAPSGIKLLTLKNLVVLALAGGALLTAQRYWSSRTALPSPPIPVVQPDSPALKPKPPVVRRSSEPALAPPSRKYQQISVSVERQRAGVAEVRVLDSKGKEVRALFMGILPKGEKTFTWDGKMENGSLAPPGEYSMEVKSGKDILQRKVLVGPALTP